MIHISAVAVENLYAKMFSEVNLLILYLNVTVVGLITSLEGPETLSALQELLFGARGRKFNLFHE